MDKRLFKICQKPIRPDSKIKQFLKGNSEVGKEETFLCTHKNQSPDHWHAITETVMIYRHLAREMGKGEERKNVGEKPRIPLAWGGTPWVREGKGGEGRALLTVIIFLSDIVRADERRQSPHIPLEDALVYRVVCGATASICDDSNGVGAR